MLGGLRAPSASGAVLSTEAGVGSRTEQRRAPTWLRLLQHEATIGKGASQRQHVYMVAVVAAEILWRLARGGELTDGRGAIVGLGFGFFAAAAGLHIVANREWADTTAWCTGAGLCNVAAFGCLFIAAPDLHSSILVLLPLLYIGRLQDLRGGAIATTAAIFLYLLPVIAAGGPGLDRALTFTMLGVTLAVAIGATSQAWSADLDAMERQSTLIDTMVQTVDIGLVLMDADGRYEVVNRRHHDFIALAYPAEGGPDGASWGEVYAADRETWVPPDDRPSHRAARGEDFSGEIIFIGRTGSPEQRGVSVSARSFFDDAGRRQGTVLAYHDITEAMEALRAKDGFIAMVSHELRTPLTSIMGYLDLAAETDGVPDEAARHLDVVHRNAQRLHGLVGDLLDVASAADGRVELAPERVDLAGLVADEVEHLRPYAGRQGVEICTRYAPVPSIEADAHRIRQVVDNLITNAVKYAGGSETVQVEVGDGDLGVKLTVADQGIGMTPQDVEQAFSQFFRSPSLKDQSIAGVGLGLAITRSIVERHGGVIRLDSSPGVGTTVTVELPLSIPIR